MPSYGAAGNPVDVTAQGSNTGPAMMTAMEHLAESDEIDMLLLVSSLASTTRASLDAARIRAVAAKCGKPMTVWTYTLPSEFGRNACLRLRAVPAQRSARLSAWRSANSPTTPRRWRDRCPTPFDAGAGSIGAGPAAHRAGISGEAGAGRVAAAAAERLATTRAEAAADAAAALGVSGRSESAIGRSAAQDRGRRRAAEPGDRAAVAARLHRDAGATSRATSRTRRSTACWCRRWRRKAMNWSSAWSTTRPSGRS